MNGLLAFRIISHPAVREELKDSASTRCGKDLT